MPAPKDSRGLEIHGPSAAHHFPHRSIRGHYRDVPRSPAHPEVCGPGQDH